MANPEDAAKSFLKGLGARERKPWDTEIREVQRGTSSTGTPPMGRTAPNERKSADDIGSQVERITERNREFAKRTRHLRQD